MRTRTKVALAVAGLLVAMSATAIATAQSPGEPAPAETVPAAEAPEAAVVDEGQVDGEDLKDEDLKDEECFGFFGEELDAELIDEINAEGAALAEAFDAAGIAYEMVTDDEGVTFPEWDESDEAANAVADELFDELDAEFVKDLPPEVIEEINAEGAALADAFDAAGIAYEMVTEPGGISYPEWDWEDEAANEIADEFYDKVWVDDEIEFLEEDLPPEVIEELNAEGAALAEALDAAGVAYTLETDELGITYPEWEGEAGDEVAEAYFVAKLGHCEDFDLIFDEMLEEDCDEDDHDAEMVEEDEPAAVGS